MATRGLVLYLLSGFSVAILSVFFLSHPNEKASPNPNSDIFASPYLSTTDKVWPVSLSELIVLNLDAIGVFGFVFLIDNLLCRN
jgi:hypothetical protein